MGGVRERFEAALLRAALGLPEAVQQRLAGRPLRLDGLTLAPESQLMLRLEQVAGNPAVESLPIPAGRVALDRQSRQVGGRQRIGAVRDLAVAGGAGDLPARLYTPTGAPAAGPLLVFLHGGGFMYGGLDSHDAPCRALAEWSGVRVLAVDYRLGPEHRFPAAYDDAVAAYSWALEHAAELGADVARIAVGGDSAGGNLAAGVALDAAARGLPCALQLLVYPVTLGRHDTRSFELFGRGLYLTDEFMRRAHESYARTDADRDDPRYSPARADLASLAARLAPAYVVTAGFDPLRDEGEAYAAALAAAGVRVERHRAADQIHGFFNLVGVGRRARAAHAHVADRLAVLLAG